MTITDYVRGINGSEERMGDFSSYQLDPHPIGVGGFSKVYRVSKGGHAYAMKIPMNANLSSDVTIQYDPEDRGRFMEEAEKWALASDSAPDDVVCLKDYNIEPFPWMVMELGTCSLKDMIASREAGPADIVALLRSLQHVHDNGIVHRDIKPENILNVEGRLKFTDFGLSKVVGSLTKSTGGLKGTPFYMAPEQVSVKKFGRVDSRTDIWQMGILLYEVLMHRLPFHTKDIAEIGMAITLDGPEYGDAPEWVLPVLQRALTQEKDGRFATADEFADALEAVIPEEPEVPEEPEAGPAPEQGDDATKAGPTGLVEDESRPERAKAKYDEGMDLLESGDPDNSVRALELITESSDMGYVWAQGQLAYMLLTGNGASINVERAIELYRKAADQGDEDSMYNLGLMYAQGKYLEKDMKAAKKWLNKAIIKGDYGAQRVMNMIKKLE